MVLFLILGILPWRTTIPARAQSTADEYRLKAAFLFHFAQFIDWPADALAFTDILTFCTLGEDPFHGELEAAVEGKLAGARRLRVRHFKQPQDIQGCHALFVSSAERTRIPAVLAKLTSTAVLTVGETEDFVKQGGMIGFCLEGQKVRFEINLEAAQRAGFKISSRLLLLAKRVIGNRS